MITSLGPYTDPENVSVGLNDLLICIEMPLFAFAHMYAFSHLDYVDPRHTFVARMPMYYAFRDAFGLLDVIEDSKATLRGEGMDYREFEPAEGLMHQGDGRDRRIRAGLRYSKGGQRKYWLPKLTETRPPDLGGRIVTHTIGKIARRGDETDDIHAPLLAQDADHVVHLAPDLRPNTAEEPSIWLNAEVVDNGYQLPFGDLDEGDEELYVHSQKYLFGDYNYPCIDASSESARTFIWDEEERVLRDERGAWFSPIRGAKGRAAIQQRERPAWEGYGAVSHSQNQDGKNVGGRLSAGFYDDEHAGDRIIYHDSNRTVVPAQPTDATMKWTKTRNQTPSFDGPSSTASGSGRSSPRNNHSSRIRSSPVISRHNSRTNDPPTLPSDAVDLVVEDSHAAEKEQIHERRKGETANRTRVNSHLKKIYRRGVAEAHGESGSTRVEVGEEILDGADGDHDGRPSRRSEERVVTIEDTPPLHARTYAYDYEDIDNNNPWA